jgi:hypothetical protein
LGNNKMGRAVRDAMGSLRRLGRSAVAVGRGILNVFKWTAAGITTAFTLVGYAVKKAFDFEAYRTQLRVLLGTAEKANEAFQTLADFSAQTPFQLGGIIEAYQQLQTFTNGALTTRKGLELVGDAAAARGKDFQEVAYWVGRLYSALENGDPFMDAVGALQRLGIVGGTIRGDLTDLTDAGAKFGAKWAVVQAQLARFRGGMAELSTTGRGLFSTLKDNWTLAVATFGEAFSDLAKDTIRGLIEKIQELRSSGRIEEWAESAARVVDRLATSIGMLFGDASERRAAIADLKAQFQEVVDFVGPHIVRWGRAAGRAMWDGFTGLAGRATRGVRERGRLYFTSPREYTEVSRQRYMQRLTRGLSERDVSQLVESGKFARVAPEAGATPGRPVYVQEVHPPEGIQEQ